MSDVIHHARPTATQFDAANHRTQFLARINQQAEARRPKPPLVIPVVENRPIPTPIPDGPSALEICRRIASMKLELIELTKQNSILLRKETFESDRPRINQIQRIVAHHYGFNQADLQSQRRDLKTAWARQVAAYLCKQLTAHSFVKIGQTFGGRDHSTIMSSIAKITRLRTADPKLDAELKSIQETIVSQLRPASQQIEDATCSSPPITAV